MTEPTTKGRPVFWPTVKAWALFTAVMSASFMALEPRTLFSTGLSAFGKAFGAAGNCVSGFISGAVIGFILGCVAGAIRSIVARDQSESPAPKRKGLVIAAVIGLAVGGLNIASSGVPQHYFASNTSCSTTQSEVTQAQQFAKNHLFQDAYDTATKALQDNNSCDEPDHTVNAGLAYFVRMASADRLQKPYDSDAKHAHDALASCVALWGGQNSSDPAGNQCSFLLQSTERYMTQRFCNESFLLTSKADGEIEKNDYSAAATDGTAAASDADRCKNAYSYAYKGMALLEEGAALYLDGNTGSGASSIRQASPLLDRCISELTGAAHDQDLLKACNNEKTAANAFMSKIGI